MGKIPDGIFGGFSGRVGRVVGYNWRGEDMLRRAPKKRPQGSGTLAQIQQREKFALVIKFLSPIRDVVSMYFGAKYRAKSRYNLATSYNLTNAVIEAGGGFELDYPKVLITKGGLRGMESGAVATPGPNLLEVNWTDNSGQGSAAGDDNVLIIVYSSELGLFQIFDPAALRNEATVQLVLPSNFTGETVVVWGSMISANRKIAAMSSYLGSVTIT
jgi:hypothetical protein